MSVLVVAATGLELAAALGAPAGWRQGEVLEIDAFGRRVLGLVTGIGVVNAALELGRALARSDVTGVLNLGVAGSFDLASHPVGAVRLVERECWPEYGLLAAGEATADARGLGFPLNDVSKTASGGSCDAIFETLTWDAPAELAALGLAARDWQTASSLTVSGVTADAPRARALVERFGAGLENMEGFALAYGARRSRLPFAELRAVSNAVGVRPPEGWNLPGALSALGQAARRILAP
jgi:futalosine hydrolase